MKNRSNFLFVAAVLGLGWALIFQGCQVAETDPAGLVNVFTGTGGDGHTYPGAVLPFGMVQLSPDTRLTGQASCGGYYYPDSSIIGFSHTHLSGVGEPEFRDILFMPTVGEVKTNPGDASSPTGGYRSSFTHAGESAEPGYYAVRLDDYQIDVELTATPRCGFHKYTFPETDSGHIIIDLLHPDGAEESWLRQVNDREIEGLRRSHGWAWDQYVYFVARFSKPFTLSDQVADSLSQGVAVLNYSTSEGEEVFVKVGISAVSTEGARENLNAEIPGWDFDQLRTKAAEAWNSELGRIEVQGGTPEQQTIFYTSLYHALLSPSLFMDVDSLYRGVDHQVHRATGFTNYTVFSLWDTFRGLHPLFTIVDQQRTLDFIRSLLAKYEDGGRLPMWPLAGNYTDDMLGYHAVSVIADAYMKGIRDFDVELAYEAVKHTAELDRLGLKYYKRIGYLPCDRQGESVSKTLEYCYDDWCISQMARELEQESDYQRFLQRAHFYENVFDTSTNFMRGRRLDGKWLEPFDPLVNSAYSEGNAYQYLFVPHDVEGVIKLMGGEKVFSAWLDTLFARGQYQHGNEPSHHLAYLYNYTGEAWKTQERVHRILTESYGDGPGGLAGNEDCGQMSAWYILSSMGFYSVTPGQNIYAIGRPLFDRTTIRLENGNSFTVKTVNNGPENIYIQSATLNGTPLLRSYLTHKEIMSGSTLTLQMGPLSNKEWGGAKEDRPFSDNGGGVDSAPRLTSGEAVYPGFVRTGFMKPLTRKNLFPGLTYDYFEQFFVTTADLEKVSPVESGTIDNFNLSMARKESYFGVRFKGFIKASEKGIYTFYLESNDGSRLYINGEEVIENDANHGAIEEQGGVGLQAGLHEIEVKYFQCGGGKTLKVSWEGPGFSRREFAPTELFYQQNETK
ncbi:MAG: GH92 family glycosyl hydrolase [Bacteroidota bacterium]